MATDIGKFRALMDKMIKYLEECVPNDKELEKQKLKLETGMKSNPRGTIEMFVDSVTPHADHILQGDDSYFIDKDAASLGVDATYLQFAEKLKTLWTKLTEDQQERVKNFFKLLLMLGAIVTKNEALRVLINKYRDPSNPLLY